MRGRAARRFGAGRVELGIGAVDTNDEALVRRVGQVVADHWTLERLIGAGGMAAVYAARTPEGEVAALKLLHPEMGLKSDIRERFLREAYAANRVEHPGAVRVLGHGTTDEGVAYLVMELLEGEPLRDRVERHGKLPVSELLATGSRWREEGLSRVA